MYNEDSAIPQSKKINPIIYENNLNNLENVQWGRLSRMVFDFSNNANYQ